MEMMERGGERREAEAKADAGLEKRRRRRRREWHGGGVPFACDVEGNRGTHLNGEIQPSPPDLSLIPENSFRWRSTNEKPREGDKGGGYKEQTKAGWERRRRLTVKASTGWRLTLRKKCEGKFDDGGEHGKVDDEVAAEILGEFLDAVKRDLGGIVEFIDDDDLESTQKELQCRTTADVARVAYHQRALRRH
ncbi:hypothetical protein Droror1_Dr00018429 [Drosera rotundifolia]